MLYAFLQNLRKKCIKPLLQFFIRTTPKIDKTVHISWNWLCLHGYFLWNFTGIKIFIGFREIGKIAKTCKIDRPSENVGGNSTIKKYKYKRINLIKMHKTEFFYEMFRFLFLFIINCDCLFSFSYLFIKRVDSSHAKNLECTNEKS